jgi:hypothetical protein
MSQVVNLGRRQLRLALLAAAALVSVVVLISAASQADAARTVYFPSKCNNAAFEPHQIVVTCADGKTTFRTTGWKRWGTASAHTTGVLVMPECGNTPLFKCDTYAEHQATITLSAPQNCAGRWQFRRLFIDDQEASTPSVRQIKIGFPC